MDSKEADEKIQEAQESSSPKAVESISPSPPVVGIELNPSTPQKEEQSPPKEEESAIEKDEEIEDPATQEHNEADKTKESSLEKSDERYKSNEDKELISQEFEFDPEGKEEGNLQDQQYESQFQGDHSCLDTPEKPSEDLSGEIYQNLEEKEKKETVNLTEEQKQDQNIKEEGCHEEIPTVEADDADQVEDPQDISYSSPENQIIVKSPEDGHLKCSPCHPNPLHHSRMDTDNQDDEEDEDTGDILKTLDDSQEEANQNPLIKENDTTENQQDIHQEIVATEESEPKFEEQDEGEKDQQDYIEEDGPNHTLETQLETDQDVENNPPDCIDHDVDQNLSHENNSEQMDNSHEVPEENEQNFVKNELFVHEDQIEQTQAQSFVEIPQHRFWLCPYYSTLNLHYFPNSRVIMKRLTSRQQNMSKFFRILTVFPTNIAFCFLGPVALASPVRLEQKFESVRQPVEAPSAGVAAQIPNLEELNIVKMKHLREKEEMIAQIRALETEALKLQQQAQTMYAAKEQSDQIYLDLRQEMQRQKSDTQYKIGFLLRQKQEAEAMAFQQKEVVKKYSAALAQAGINPQNVSQAPNMPSPTSACGDEELRSNFEGLQQKLAETEEKLKAQSEEYSSIKTENENLQLDLKSLLEIEQSLRNSLGNAQSKISEDRRFIVDTMNENENMKQDLMQFSKAVEMSSRENEVLRQEIQMLKDQLMKKEHDKSHNASSMADKENEIFTLKAEIARTKAMVNASTPISQHSEYKPGSPGLDMLMKQNSHDFATDYLASLKLKTNESAGYNLQNYEDSKINSQSLSTNMQSTYEKFGYKGPMAQPGLSNFSSDSNMSETNFQNTNFSRPQSAMPDQIPDGTSMEPQSISGLQSSTMRGQTSSLNLPNTRFQKQEWNNYLS